MMPGNNVLDDLAILETTALPVRPQASSERRRLFQTNNVIADFGRPGCIIGYFDNAYCALPFLAATRKQLYYAADHSSTSFVSSTTFRPAAANIGSQGFSLQTMSTSP